MNLTWPETVVMLGIFVKLSFVLWLYGRHLAARSERDLQERAFALEERKFEVWKTVQLAHTAQQGGEARRLVSRVTGGFVSSEMEPNPGKVVPLFGSRKPEVTHALVRTFNENEEPTPERMKEIAEVVRKVRELPEDEARELLAAHGIDEVSFDRDDA